MALTACEKGFNTILKQGSAIVMFCCTFLLIWPAVLFTQQQQAAAELQ
jgi:hypothetical protein